MDQHSFMSDMSMGFRRSCFTVYVKMPKSVQGHHSFILWAAFRNAADRDGYLDYLKSEHPDWQVVTKFPGRNYADPNRFKYDKEY